ncbi:recombinase family protein [Nocardia sp. NPDC004085]
MNTSDNETNNTSDQALAILFLSIASSNGAAAGLEMITMQRERGEQKAADLHARVVHEFVEIGVAATDYRKRPVVRKLLDYLDQHPGARYVIFPTVGRVSRTLEGFHELTRQFDERGVVLTFSSEDNPVLLRPDIPLPGALTEQQNLIARAHRRRKAPATSQGHK